MQVAILCGGLGTRLREETEFKPKAMVEIGGRPIVWHIMRYYQAFGHDRFLLCTGYRGEVIKQYFLNYRRILSDLEVDLSTGDVTLLGRPQEDLPWKVRIQDTGVDTLTGTRLKHALRYLDDDLFLATYGDGVANVDLDGLIAHHRRSGKLATVTAVRPSSRFGELDLQGDMVHSFIEKPQTAEGWINGGFFVFHRRIFEELSGTENITLEQGVLEDLADRRELSVFRHNGFWQCMDTQREMHVLEDYWSRGRAPWKVW